MINLISQEMIERDKGILWEERVLSKGVLRTGVLRTCQPGEARNTLTILAVYL